MTRQILSWILFQSVSCQRKQPKNQLITRRKCVQRILLWLTKGDKVIWDHMKKKNLPTHTVSIKITGWSSKIASLFWKKIKNWWFVFLIVSRKRLALNLEKYICQCEFSVVPMSLFTSDGKPSLESKKADVMHGIGKKWSKRMHHRQMTSKPSQKQLWYLMEWPY